MIEDLKNPYRRSFLIAALEEIETEGQIINKNVNSIYESMYDHMIFLFDVLITTIVNMVSKNKRDTMFPEWKRKRDEKKPNVFTLPNGQKVIIEE